MFSLFYRSQPFVRILFRLVESKRFSTFSDPILSMKKREGKIAHNNNLTKSLWKTLSEGRQSRPESKANFNEVESQASQLLNQSTLMHSHVNRFNLRINSWFSIHWFIKKWRRRNNPIKNKRISNKILTTRHQFYWTNKQLRSKPSTGGNSSTSRFHRNWWKFRERKS